MVLLDEPDAHQHVILQRQVYDLIRGVARERGGQVILATHSEVVLNATQPDRVLGCFGEVPRALAGVDERDRLREALKEFFERPFVHWLGGRSLREAKAHFFAMRAAFPDLMAECLLDGDNRDEPDEETTRAGLVVLRWRRYEIENYLLQPGAIARFASMGFPLIGPRMEAEVDEGFWRQVPRGTDLFGDHVSLVRVKASDEFLVPLLERLERPMPRKDLYLLAAAMNHDELHPEVTEKLDRIADALNVAAAAPGA